jgi:hypothetical protein
VKKNKIKKIKEEDVNFGDDALANGHFKEMYRKDTLVTQELFGEQIEQKVNQDINDEHARLRRGIYQQCPLENRALIISRDRWVPCPLFPKKLRAP